MFCPNCGGEVNDTAKFCAKCGAKMDGATPVAAQQGAPPTPPPPPHAGAYQPPPRQAPQPAAAPGGTIDVMDCVRQGWNMTMSNIGMFVVGALIVLGIQAGVGFIPFAGIFLLPLNAGLLIMAFKVMSGGTPEIADAFGGFRRYVDLLLVQLVAGIFIAIGFVLLIVPGIFLMVCYTMAIPLVTDRGMGFWDAMSLSMSEVRKQWFTIFCLGLMMFVVNLLGALALGVGVFISFPVSVCALAVAYSQMFGTQNNLP